jgi:ferredoxin
MKAIVDENICTGCGTCVEICPEVFELQDDHAVNILGNDKTIPADYEETCREAAEACPVEAIIIGE